ncbi:MAG: hypothetical protein ACREAC_11415 [Blastocatellia bacterium]
MLKGAAKVGFVGRFCWAMLIGLLLKGRLHGECRNPRDIAPQRSRRTPPFQIAASQYRPARPSCFSARSGTIQAYVAEGALTNHSPGGHNLLLTEEEILAFNKSGLTETKARLARENSPRTNVPPSAAPPVN